ncbi:hypothetical protein [Faecalimicrobium dakarense]|uniref:hypothetical protein n=1 Tax=Faecalimicrobium dakarense TaxID=1301100 RepID=UPI0004B4896D|nr:hypothetical protein [[Clostridium] dakarense]
MKKNKTIAYALAATLLVGGTFVGTKAWFTNEETVTSELVIVTGGIGLEVEESDWKSDGLNAYSQGDNRWDALAPGDILTKIVTVKNGDKGRGETNLDRELKVEGGKQTNGTENYEITTPGLEKIENLSKGETGQFEIVVKVNENMLSKDAYGDSNEFSEFAPGKNMEPIKITATQIKKNN